MKYPKKFLEFIIFQIEVLIYRNYYVNGIDILKDGRLSCAKFVSEILFKFGMIASPHATVLSTIKDLISSGWVFSKISSITSGDIIVWEKNQAGHFHIGFYVGNKEAISNDRDKRFPIKHSYDYNGKIRILFVLTR